MRHSKLFSTPASATVKIKRLCSLLLKEKTLLEEMASHITDGALRCTVLSLAQQNNQYAAELKSYIKSTDGVEYPSFVIEPGQSSDLPTVTNELNADETGVLKYCRNIERKIVFAYRRLLKDSFLYEGLQNIIDYQFSGILAAFVQINLLSSLRKA